MSHNFKVDDYAFQIYERRFYRIVTAGFSPTGRVVGKADNGTLRPLSCEELLPVAPDNPMLLAALNTAPAPMPVLSAEEQFKAVTDLLTQLQNKGGLGITVHNEISRVQSLLTGPFVRTVGEPAQPSSDLTPDDVLDTAVVVLTELYRADPAAAYLLATVKYPTTTTLTEHATIICNPLLIADREEDPIAAVGMVGVLNGILLRLGTSQRLASRWTKSLPEKFLGFTKMPIE